MVIHYPPRGFAPTATSRPRSPTSCSPPQGRPHTGEIPLGTPTCSARTRHGRWALYPNGEEVVVAWPGGALVGLPAEVARELDRLGGNGHDVLDRGAAWAIRQFLTDPAAADAAQWSSARARTWSRPAVGYWLSGPTNQPSHHPHQPASRPGAPTRSRRCRCPTPARSRPRHEPLDHSPTRHASSRHIDGRAAPRVTRRRPTAVADRPGSMRNRERSDDMTAATSTPTTAPLSTRPPAPPGCGCSWTPRGPAPSRGRRLVATLADPDAELPGLIASLDASLGPVTRVALNLDAWDTARAAWPWTVAASAWAGSATWTPTRSG